MGTISISELIDSIINPRKRPAQEQLSNLMSAYGVKTPNELLSTEMPIQARETTASLIKDAFGFEMPRTEVGGGGQFIDNFAINQPKASFVTPPPATTADYQRRLTGAEAEMFKPSKEAQIANATSEIKAKEYKQQQFEAGSNYHKALSSLINEKGGILNIKTSDINKLNFEHPNIDGNERVAIQKGLGIDPEKIYENESFSEATNNLQNAIKNHIPLTLGWFAENMFKQVGPTKSLQIMQDFIPKATKRTLGDVQVEIVNKFRNKEVISPEDMSILIFTLAEANPIAGTMLQAYMIPRMNELKSENPLIKNKAQKEMADYYRSIVTGFNFPELEKTDNTYPSGNKKIEVNKPEESKVYKEKKPDFIYTNGKLKPTR